MRLRRRSATLIIDDTLVPRVSKQAPGVAVRHDHARKANRPAFLNSQGWVTLALVVRATRRAGTQTVPLCSRLIESINHPGKLLMALDLVQSLRGRPRKYGPRLSAESKPRLLIATETHLNAVSVITIFAAWMRHQFTGLCLRPAYQAKSRKFVMSEPAPTTPRRC